MSRPMFVPRRLRAPGVDGATHAVVVPITVTPKAPDGVRIWHESIRASRDAGASRAFRQAEAIRPLAADQRLRILAVHYGDGRSDIIVVGDRAAYGSAALLDLARAVAVGRPTAVQDIEPRPTGSADVHPNGANVEPFASQHRSTANQDHLLVEPWGTENGRETELLVAATAIVLGRVGRVEQPAIAVFGAASDKRHEGTRFLAPNLEDRLAIQKFIASIAEPLRDDDGSSWHTATLRADERVGAAVFRSVELQIGEETYPASRAPFPLTLCPVIDASGDVSVHALARGEDASLEEFASLVRTVRFVYDQLVDPCERQLRDISLAPVEVAASLTGRDVRRGDGPSVDNLFAAVAEAQPTAPALTVADRTISYGELDDLGTTIAAALQASGVRPGDRVGIALERDANLVATMLGVARAGGTYVPMDPAYPTERLRYIVEDAQLQIVVTDRADFPAGPEVRLLTPADLLAHEERVVSGWNGQLAPAYVIYTSGSTGRPKGVVIAHASVVALIEATRGDFGLVAEDTWTFFHSGAFDFAVWEIWGALLTGARLVVVPYWMTRDPDDFWGLLHRERVTVLSQTPSAFRQLDEMDSRHAERLSVRLVIFGGESLDARRLRSWFDRYPERVCRLVNMFGITETTVHVTAKTVRREDALAGTRSVGVALPGWSVSVRDEYLRPLPPGFPGEIVVGGVGLAREYLHRPDLTAERFMVDPITDGLVYRSGDLGRLRPDGELDHLGRIDSQVQLRGFRIELGEIAAVLERLPGVAEAAVVVGGDVASDPANARLDAYVVGTDIDFAQLRGLVAEYLPVHMVPTTISLVLTMPLTPNGKLDAAALPDPLSGHTGSVVSPQTSTTAASSPTWDVNRLNSISAGRAADAVQPLGKRLLSLWTDLLGVTVTPDDNFFELGGNSLLAVRLGTAMREAGLPTLSIRMLYLNPTPSSLATAIEEEAAA